MSLYTKIAENSICHFTEKIFLILVNLHMDRKYFKKCPVFSAICTKYKTFFK